MSRKLDTTPFDRERIPPKQNLLIMPLLWIWCRAATFGGHLRIRKVRMKGLRPPYIVLGTHHSFLDFYVTPLALFPHRANYVSELEGFEAYGEWKYRQIGCLGTRKFVNDLSLIRNIDRVMKRKGILVLYPEARYANVGTSSAIPPSVGKLCKHLHVPIVTINMKGNYLQSPIWNLRKRKGVRLQTTITQLFTVEEAEKASAEEINERVRQALTYDEYAWQIEAGIRIQEPFRAEGLHMPLYRCLACETDFSMRSSGESLTCDSCGARWVLREDGLLQPADGDPVRIPDWYEKERDSVRKEIDEGRYVLDTTVRVRSLPNAINFIDLGEGRLRHDRTGFALTFCDYGKSAEETLFIPATSSFSVHTEYDYRGEGPCITLSEPDNTFFLFPLENGFNATRIQFATEYFWELSQRRKKPPVT